VVSSPAEALAALQAPVPHQRREAALYLANHPGPEAFAALLEALGDLDAQADEAIIVALVQQPAADLVPRLVTILRESHATRRNAALSALIEIGAHTPHILLAALRDPGTEVRLHVAEILGDLRDPGATTALLERLSDPQELSNVRHTAAQALGKIGDRAAAPALIAAAVQGDFWVRYAAVEALGRLGDERAVGALLRLMQQDAWTRPAIVQALGNIGQVDAVPALVAALDDNNDAVRMATMEALIKIVVEPHAADQLPPEKLAELRRLIPASPLLRELHARAAPSSAYAAHLLGWLLLPEALPDLIAALGYSDEAVRYAAVEALLRYGPTARAPLVDALSNPEPLIRENAAELLGMLADASAVPILLAHRQDENINVRQAVLRALGSLGGEAAYEGLLQALEDPATQDTALGILGQLRHSSLAGGLTHYLQRYLYEGKPATRWAAAQALSLFGDETSVSILLNATRLPDETIRRPAADALARVRGNRAVNVLIEALGDRDWLVRQKAVEALSSIPDGRAVAALLPMANDPEWRVRKALVAGLGRVNDGRIYEPLQQLTRDSDRWVRRAVMDAAVALEDSRASEILLRGLKDEELAVRRAALVSLGRRRDPGTAPAVEALLADPDVLIRHVAVRVAAQVGGPRAAERIAQLADDPVESIRMETAEALADLGSEESIDALETLLQDQSAEVRKRAAEALAHVGTVRAAEALVGALRDLTSREAAQTQLMKMGELAQRALLNATRSAEPELRAAAAETLGQLGQQHVVPTLKLLLRDSDARVRAAAEAAVKALASQR
jgi:HEAT repeat protein